MKPSREALDIQRAHWVLKVCLGTQYEAAARRNLEAVVAEAKRRAS